jgi:hypothetical protein
MSEQGEGKWNRLRWGYKVDGGIHIFIWNRAKKPLAIALREVVKGVRGRRHGGNLTSVQYKPSQDCHYESPPYNEYTLIKIYNKNISCILSYSWIKSPNSLFFLDVHKATPACVCVCVCVSPGLNLFFVYSLKSSSLRILNFCLLMILCSVRIRYWRRLPLEKLDLMDLWHVLPTYDPGNQC